MAEESLKSFDSFLNALTTGSKDSIEAYRGTDIHLGSHIPFGIPTRVPALDMAIGRPGWPVGRCAEIFGFEHVGKTTLGLSACSAAQRMGGYGAFIDAERAFSPSWARRNGCDPDKLIVCEADTIEGIFEVHKQLIETYMKMDEKVPFVIVTDSITAVPSLESSEKGYQEKERLGVDARATRSGLRKLNASIAKSKILCLFINHQISSMSQYQADDSAGGHALKLYAGLRVKVALASNLRDDSKTKEFLGKIISIEIKKNKVGETGSTKFPAHLLKNGFDLYENLLDALIQLGLVTKPNAQTYVFLPETDKAVTFKRKEWRVLVDEQTEGIDALYEWFLKKAMAAHVISPYGV